MRRLPPLNALRVFEVAARTSGYAELKANPRSRSAVMRVAEKLR